MNQVTGLCCSLCTFGFIEEGMKFTVQLHSGLVWFPFTFYFFFVVTLFARAHLEWVEVTPSPSHSCMSRAWYESALTRPTNSFCDWASIKIDVCALAMKGGFKHPLGGTVVAAPHIYSGPRPELDKYLCTFLACSLAPSSFCGAIEEFFCGHVLHVPQRS